MSAPLSAPGLFGARWYTGRWICTNRGRYYYRLLCAGCGRMVGNVGDRLLPDMAAALVDGQFDLYATGLLGCPCGHQRERARELDPGRWRESQTRHGVTSDTATS